MCLLPPKVDDLDHVVTTGQTKFAALPARAFRPLSHRALNQLWQVLLRPAARAERRPVHLTG
jgi:hypothetical protein